MGQDQQGPRSQTQTLGGTVICERGWIPLHVYGSAPVDLFLTGVPYQADIVMVSPLTTEAILGLDFLKEHKVTVDAGESKLHLSDRAIIELYQDPQSCSKQDVVSVVYLSNFLIASIF